MHNDLIPLGKMMNFVPSGTVKFGVATKFERDEMRRRGLLRKMMDLIPSNVEPAMLGMLSKSETDPSGRILGLA